MGFGTRAAAWAGIAVWAASFASAQTKAESADVEKLLEDGAKRFLNLIERVDETQWNFRPTGVRHTIGEEAEHIALTENELQTVIERAQRAGPVNNAAATTAGKLKAIRDFFVAEEAVAENFRPQGKIVNQAEAREFFQAAHAKLMRLFRSSKDLSDIVYKHPSEKFGLMNGLQWFYYIAYHRERHMRQIEAVAAHAEYPGRAAASAAAKP